MNLDWLAVKIAKSDGARCDDGVGTGGQLGAFAVTDGLGSEAATSGYFAQEVADWYVRAPAVALDEVARPEAAASSLAQRWMSLPDTLGKYIDNGKQSFENAGCTLAGVHITPNPETKTYSVRGLVVGDSAVFCIDGSDWAGMDNLGQMRDRAVKDADDAATPSALRIDFKNRAIKTTILPHFIDVESRPGAVILLTTDALAAWLHRELSANTVPTQMLSDLLTLQNESQFTEWTRKLCFAHELAVDDVAMVRISLGEITERVEEANGKSQSVSPEKNDCFELEKRTIGAPVAAMPIDTGIFTDRQPADPKNASSIPTREKPPGISSTDESHTNEFPTAKNDQPTGVLCVETKDDHKENFFDPRARHVRDVISGGHNDSPWRMLGILLLGVIAGSSIYKDYLFSKIVSQGPRLIVLNTGKTEKVDIIPPQAVVNPVLAQQRSSEVASKINSPTPEPTLNYNQPSPQNLDAPSNSVSVPLMTQSHGSGESTHTLDMLYDGGFLRSIGKSSSIPLRPVEQMGTGNESPSTTETQSPGKTASPQDSNPGTPTSPPKHHHPHHSR